MLYFSDTIKSVPYNIVTAQGITIVRRMNVVGTRDGAIGKFNALIQVKNKNGILVNKPCWIDWDTVVFELKDNK